MIIMKTQNIGGPQSPFPTLHLSCKSLIHYGVFLYRFDILCNLFNTLTGTLTPLVLVRIQVPQPNKIKDLAVIFPIFHVAKP